MLHIVKLNGFFATCDKSGKLLGTYEKFRKCVTSLKIVLQFLEYFVTCGKSEQYFGNSERLRNLVTSPKINICTASAIFVVQIELWEFRKIFGKLYVQKLFYFNYS